MPPMPRIGTSGIAACTCHTRGRRPGGSPGRTGRRSRRRGRAQRVGVDDHPEQRVDHRQAVAPASTTARATATMSVTSGESLAKIGTRVGERAHRRDDRRGRDGVAGEDLAAVLDVRAGDVDLEQREPRAPRNLRGEDGVFLDAELPAIETTARAPCSSSHGRSLSRKASMPGPCRPIELSMPLGVSAIRGVGRPERGLRMMDLVTTAPSVGEVEELGELLAGGRAAGRGEDRVRERTPARVMDMSTSAAATRGSAWTQSSIGHRTRSCRDGADVVEATRSPAKTGPSRRSGPCA